MMTVAGLLILAFLAAAGIGLFVFLVSVFTHRSSTGIRTATTNGAVEPAGRSDSASDPDSVEDFESAGYGESGGLLKSAADSRPGTRPHRSPGTAVIAGSLLTGTVLLLCLLVVGSKHQAARVSVQQARVQAQEARMRAQAARATALATRTRLDSHGSSNVSQEQAADRAAPADQASSEDSAAASYPADTPYREGAQQAAVASEGTAPDDTALADPDQAAALPEWTQTGEQVLAAGRVPVVRRVVRSGLYATVDEARQVAYQKLQDDLRTRLIPDYPALATWTIPRGTLDAVSVKHSHVEVRRTRFGQYTEPMFQVWLQYEDSPRVREPIVALWRESAAHGRTIQLAAGAGLLALLLGTISTAVRAAVAPSGRRAKAVLATLALGTGTGLAALSLLVG